MPIEVDLNFPLVDNKALLQEAGHRPARPRLAKLDDANEKLYRKTGNHISRLGHLRPWMTYGSGNALLTFFGVFGGGYFPPGSTDQTKLDMTQAGNVPRSAGMET